MEHGVNIKYKVKIRNIKGLILWENAFLQIWLIFGYVVFFILNKCFNGHNLMSFCATSLEKSKFYM